MIFRLIFSWRKVMRKIVATLLAVPAIVSASMSFAASEKTVMVINSSQFPATVHYSVCSVDNGGICTMNTRVLENVQSPGNNYMKIALAGGQKLALSAQTHVGNGNIRVSETDHTCKVPHHAEVVVLSDYSTPRLVCHYADFNMESK
jgi:hypothetical protein